MATKTVQSDAAHQLVRGLALRQRMLESAPVSISHVAGTDNVLADIASRPIPTIDDDSAFLTHFDSAFPLQYRYWRRASPLPVQLSNVILTLRGQRLTMQRWTLKSGPPTGAGVNTAPSVEFNPWLRDITPPARLQLLSGFAARTRTGYFGKGRQVTSQTVEKAMHHMARAFMLEGYPDPRCSSGSSGSNLALPVTHLLKSYKDRDPVPRPQVALPVGAIRMAAAARLDAAATPWEQATAHLIVMAFYFLLRVGEYTLPPSSCHRPHYPVSSE
jgi:hypothetical protein